MNGGEIQWYKFALPDKAELSSLPAQTNLIPLRYKKRPVLILTRESVLEYLGEVTIAPITTTVCNMPSEVFLSTT